MAKVYVSSTVADLKAERDAVIAWLVQAGHQPVHSYAPDSDTVRDSCLNDIDECALYVLIVGHRNGHVPERDNPEHLSITRLEYRRAVERNMPRVVLVRTSVPDVTLSDLEHPDLSKQVLAFRKEVQQGQRAAQFADLADLIAGLSTGVPRELAKRKDASAPVAPSDQALQIIETLTGHLVSKDAEIAALRAQVRERALETGDSRPPDALLSQDQQAVTAPAPASAHDEASARRLAADLAREQGALALGHDARAALAAYELAAKIDPQDTWAHFFVGDMWVALGDLDKARRWYARAADTVAQRFENDLGNAGALRDLSVSHDRTGDVLLAQGDLKAALAAFRKGLAIRDELVRRDAANTQWLRDLSISHNKIGDVLVAQGDLSAALAAFRESVAIREALAAGDAANTQWQRDLSVSHDRIGDVLLALGDLDAALVAFRNSLAIREALAARDPANTEGQRDLSISHNKVGDVLVAQGDLGAALATFRKSASIRDVLAARDAANTEWQRDLSISHNRIGNVLVAQGELGAALATFRKGLAIAEVLAARDAANTEWQRDLSVSHEKIGNVLVAQQDLDAALDAFRKSLAIAEALAARDPANAQWQIDVATSCSRLGAHSGLSADERRRYLTKGRYLLLTLKAEGRLPPPEDTTAWFEQQLKALDQDGTDLRPERKKGKRKKR